MLEAVSDLCDGVYVDRKKVTERFNIYNISYFLIEPRHERQEARFLPKPKEPKYGDILS